MSTSHLTSRRRVRRGALALALSAICLPAGSALAAGDTKSDYPGEPPGSAGYVGTHYPVRPSTGDTKYDLQGSDPAPAKAGDTPSDFPGMPGGPVIPEPVTDGGSQGSGFDWTSAAIGAGGAGLLIVVSLGGASAAARVRMRTVRS
jgi:hypothetical protein